MQNVILSSISIDDLTTIIRSCVKSEMANSVTQPPNEEEFITENEVKEILQVSKVTLKKWRDNGKLPYYRIGSRIRYKRHEILVALQSSKNNFKM
jgi:excisionase family DNA binding protein